MLIYLFMLGFGSGSILTNSPTLMKKLDPDPTLLEIIPLLSLSTLLDCAQLMSLDLIFMIKRNFIFCDFVIVSRMLFSRSKNEIDFSSSQAVNWGYF